MRQSIFTLVSISSFGYVKNIIIHKKLFVLAIPRIIGYTIQLGTKT